MTDAVQHPFTQNLSLPSTFAAALDALLAASHSHATLAVGVATLARLLRRDAATETIPVDITAKQLGIHRNSVSRAYNVLAAAGLIQRIPVAHRGAPTRTRLKGVLLAAVSSRSMRQSTGADASPAPPPAALPLNPTSFLSGPSVDVSAPPSRQGKSVAPAAVAVSDPDNEQAAPFAFNPATMQSVMVKVPAAHRELAMAAASPRVVVVLPEWDLSPEEDRHFRRLAAKRESAPRKSAARPESVRQALTERVAVSPEIARHAWEVLPVLQSIAGPKRGGELMDEIAFSIAATSLGRGDALVGVRAALSLIRKGRWQLPRGMCSAWRGTVMRAMNPAHHERNHAPCAVH